MAVDLNQSYLISNSLRRKGKLEITIIIALALILFFGAQALPISEWLEFVVQNESSFFDETIFLFVTLSFVFPIFSIIRWRDLRGEVSARALLVKQLEDSAQTNAQLSEMTNLLHSCSDLEESSQIISHYARHLFPESAGALYIFRASRNLLDLAVYWGEAKGYEPVIAPHQCWALRQGQIYEVQNPQLSVMCLHVPESYPYICLPMMAHGEVLALLHVRPKYEAEANMPATEAKRSRLRGFAEYISLALSNVKLRDTLRQQSIRDPLTGLFNRRYLEETLVIETERAKRNERPFSVMMLDIDHFKRFNDTHGHDAGDAVLEALGKFLQTQVRAGDIVCRYGGEEFTLILPGAPLEMAQQRAEKLCTGVKTLALDFKGHSLGPLTLSVGVATYPSHGESAEIVLQAADGALYQAKNEGRDRVKAAV